MLAEEPGLRSPGRGAPAEEPRPAVRLLCGGLDNRVARGQGIAVAMRLAVGDWRLAMRAHGPLAFGWLRAAPSRRGAWATAQEGRGRRGLMRTGFGL
jgi:hypothetical protein